MKVFNLSPWVWLLILLGLVLVPALGVGGYTLRNLPAGMKMEYAIHKAPFRSVDADLSINGQSIKIHGILRCRYNPYPGLSEAPDFSFPDAIVKTIAPDHDVTLVLRGACMAENLGKSEMHYTVIDRIGADAAVYLTDSPQLAGSKVVLRPAEAADWELTPDDYADNCDEDGFSNTGRIGVWHLDGASFMGDMVSALGAPPDGKRIDGLSNYAPTGGSDLSEILRDWKVRTLVRDSYRACATDESFNGKTCRGMVDTRRNAYNLAEIDGGALPAVHLNNGSLTLGEQSVVRVKRSEGLGYAHNMHIAVKAGERMFYIQRQEYCLAKVWRP